MFEYAANENDDAMRMPMLVKIAKAMVKYYEDCPRWCYCQFTQKDYNTFPIAGWWLTANERPFAEWFVKNILLCNNRLRQRCHLLSYEFYSDRVVLCEAFVSVATVEGQSGPEANARCRVSKRP